MLNTFFDIPGWRKSVVQGKDIVKGLWSLKIMSPLLALQFQSSAMGLKRDLTSPNLPPGPKFPPTHIPLSTEEGHTDDGEMGGRVISYANYWVEPVQQQCGREGHSTLFGKLEQKTLTNTILTHQAVN